MRLFQLIYKLLAGPQRLSEGILLETLTIAILIENLFNITGVQAIISLNFFFCKTTVDIPTKMKRTKYVKEWFYAS